MNQSTQKTETPPLQINPIPRQGIPGFIGVLLYILVALSALVIPWSVTELIGTSPLPDVMAEGISLLFLILLAIYFHCTSRLSGKVSRGITPLMVICGFLTYYLFGSLVPTALIFALIFAVGEGSVLLAVAGKLQYSLFPVIPIVAFIAALALTRRPDIALLSILPFPAALVLAFGTRSSAGKEKGLTRVGVICATSLTLGLTAAAFALWFIYSALGTLAPSAIMEQLDHFRSYLVTTLVTMEFNYGGTVTVPLAGQEAAVTNIVNSMVNTLPATLVVLVNVTATFSQMLTFSGLRAFGYASSLTPKVQDFRISPVSAAVFLISWVVSLIAVGDNASSTMVGTVAENIFTVLMPGLALSGIFRFMRAMAQRGARLGCGFFLIVLIPCLIAYIPTIIATVESVISVFGPLFNKLKIPKENSSGSDPSKKPGSPLSDEELFERYCREQEERQRRNGSDEDDSDSKDT